MVAVIGGWLGSANGAIVSSNDGGPGSVGVVRADAWATTLASGLEVGFGVAAGFAVGRDVGFGVGIGVGLAVGFGVGIGVAVGFVVIVRVPASRLASLLSRARALRTTGCVPTGIVPDQLKVTP
jgi:hypothetical protein